jgi:hypothetical protein
VIDIGGSPIPFVYRLTGLADRGMQLSGLMSAILGDFGAETGEWADFALSRRYPNRFASSRAVLADAQAASASGVTQIVRMPRLSRKQRLR